MTSTVFGYSALANEICKYLGLIATWTYSSSVALRTQSRYLTTLHALCKAIRMFVMIWLSTATAIKALRQSTLLQQPATAISLKSWSKSMTPTLRKEQAQAWQSFTVQHKGTKESFQFSFSTARMRLTLRQSTKMVPPLCTLLASVYSSKMCKHFWNSGQTQMLRTLMETQACISASCKWSKSNPTSTRNKR